MAHSFRVVLLIVLVTIIALLPTCCVAYTINSSNFHNNNHNHNSVFPASRRILLLLAAAAATLPPVFAYNSNNNNNNNKPTMRAWTCHGTSQRDLVDRLRQANIVKSNVVQTVMEQVDRANYVPEAPYMDAPQTIGLGQTISAPHMHAYVLEAMYPYLTNKVPPVKILDVGCGSGYLTATLGRWLQNKNPKENGSGSCILFPNNNGNGNGNGGTPGAASPTSSTSSTSFDTGRVFGIDVHPPLVELTRQNMFKGDADLLHTDKVTLALKDGWRGWPEHAPFDAIHVGAAADSLPHDLATQLKVGGVLIIPIGPNGGEQKLYKVERVAATAAANNNGSGSDAKNLQQTFVEEDYRISVLLGVRYVPLVQHPEL